MTQIKQRQQLFTEISSSLPFCVIEEELEAAKKVVEKYRHNKLALRLLHDYYTALPDACEEAAQSLAELTSKKGVHLMTVATTHHNWLYLVTVDKVALVAEYGHQLPSELLNFLGYTSSDEFYKAYRAKKKRKEYPPAGEEASHCPACGVLEKQQHLLGCVVEVCPWCNGQLQSCNCRFEKLGVDEIKTEQQIESFVELLEEKGRIVFEKEQAPSYPGTSKGLDR